MSRRAAQAVSGGACLLTRPAHQLFRRGILSAVALRSHPAPNEPVGLRNGILSSARFRSRSAADTESSASPRLSIICRLEICACEIQSPSQALSLYRYQRSEQVAGLGRAPKASAG